MPRYILELGEEGVLAEIRKAVKKTVGRKKNIQLIEMAKESIGVDYGEYAARFGSLISEIICQAMLLSLVLPSNI